MGAGEGTEGGNPEVREGWSRWGRYSSTAWAKVKRHTPGGVGGVK